MTVFIIVWTIISMPALVYNIYKMYDIEETWDVLLYPRLHRFWVEKELTGAWMSVMDIFYTIFFLPAVVIYFEFVLGMILLALVVYMVDEVIDKRKKKRKK